MTGPEDTRAQGPLEQPEDNRLPQPEDAPPPGPEAAPAPAPLATGPAARWPFVASRDIKLHHVLLVSILVLAAFTRLYRLGTPEQCYFDEVYFPTTGAEILHGDNAAWEFFGHENTHPPLSKEIMAVGMFIFGHKDYGPGGTNSCWGDTEDEPKRTDPSWLYEPFGWRFFGAVAGIGAVLFMYLIARRIFQSEVAGLAGAFLLTFDGLAFAQSRIATPDTYVLFFVLGTVYFLVSHRWALAGIFLGAAGATKWNAAFVMVPIVIYFAWRFISRYKALGPDRRFREVDRVLLIGGGITAAGVVLGVIAYLINGEANKTGALIGGLPAALGLFVILGGLAAVASDVNLRSADRGKFYLQYAAAFPVFFLAIPFAVYCATYIPMLLNGHDIGDAWANNRSAYDFHSSLEATHPYQAPWDTWPINMRPIFLYLGGDTTKIYSMGNPLIFWMGLPALAFCLWQGLRLVRVRLEAGGALRIWGNIGEQQAMLLWVVLGFIGLWLPWATQPRIMFIYHYLPAVGFVVMALAYVIHWLWHHPAPYARYLAITYLALVAVTFAYFYPHWAAVDVPKWLDESYYWFDSWR